jgi:DNA-binding transcriptional regulator YiaG
MLKVYYTFPMKDWTPEEIRDFRKTYKLTRRALGELTGVLVATVYKWERGLITPSKTSKLLLSRVAEDFKKKTKKKGS